MARQRRELTSRLREAGFYEWLESSGVNNAWEYQNIDTSKEIGNLVQVLAKVIEFVEEEKTEEMLRQRAPLRKEGQITGYREMLYMVERLQEREINAMASDRKRSDESYDLCMQRVALLEEVSDYAREMIMRTRSLEL